MPNQVDMQTKQNHKEQTRYSRSFGKGIGASVLCLSVLAGCASSPGQEQSTELVENTNTPEEVTTAPTSTTPAIAKSAPLQSSEQINSDTDIVETPDSAEETHQELTDDTTQSTEASTNSDLLNTHPDAATNGNELVETSPAPTSKAVTETSDVNAAADITSTLVLGEATTTTEVPSETLANGEEATTDEEATTGEEATPQSLTRSSKNLGKSYGIWKLKEAGNGFCKLKTPTLQIGNKEYSSQIWMDIEEHQVVVNAYMPLDIKHPKTGVQIDNQALIPFTEQVNSTRAIVTGDMTSQLSSGNVLHVLINGKEVGKKVLKRNVKLTNMNAAISALKTCSK